MRERGLVKMYKDIMITKRQLIDIRQSITNTINQIRRADEEMVRVEQQRKSWQKYQTIRNIAVSITKDLVRCPLCPVIFDSKDQLAAHKNEKHQQCGKCQEQLNVSLQEHLAFTCGQTELTCEVCFASLKKKQYDQHIKICYFRECYKCKKEVSTRAYSYHLHHCKKAKPTNLIVPCKQFTKNKENRSLAMPCCLVLS